jgi:acyl carrier protein
MKEEILEKLAEILEEDKINDSDFLESFDEWDSLTTLSLMAMADADYNVALTNDIVDEFKIVNDVVDFIIKNAK